MDLNQLYDTIWDLKLTGHPADALDICTGAMKMFSQDKVLQDFQIELLFELNREEEVLTIAKNGIAANPRSAKMHLIAGRAYAKSNQLAKAEEAFIRATRLEELLWEAHRQLGLVYIARRKETELNKLYVKLSESFFAIEADRVIGFLRGKQLIADGKIDDAREVILDYLCVCYGDHPLLGMLRELNPERTPETKLWRLSMRGGGACRGVFGPRDSEMIGDFDVLAENDFEAVRLVEQTCSYIDSPSKVVLSCQLLNKKPKLKGNKGVISAYPFYTDNDPDDYVA